MIQLPLPWPPSDWSHAQWIEQYDRLIQDEPDLARLYHCRGSHYGRMQRWPEAIQDYSKACQLRPDDWMHSEALAVTSLLAGRTDEYRTTCQSALNGSKARCSCLAEDEYLLFVLFVEPAGLRPQGTRRIGGFSSAGCSASITGSGSHVVWRRIVQGRLEQALQMLPGDNAKSTNPKDALLCLLFRAMTHHRLGDAYTSRKLLEEARQEIQKQLAEPDGEELRFQDRPVAWCMVHVALREAESLIQAAPHAQTSTAESPTGTSTGNPKK